MGKIPSEINKRPIKEDDDIENNNREASFCTLAQSSNYASPIARGRLSLISQVRILQKCIISNQRKGNEASVIE